MSGALIICVGKFYVLLVGHAFFKSVYKDTCGERH